MITLAFNQIFGIISRLISECNWWFSTGRVSRIFNWSKRLLLLLNDLTGLRLSVCVLLSSFRFFFFFLIIISGPRRIFTYRIILEFRSGLLLILILRWDSPYFTWVTPSIIGSFTIIMWKTKSASSTWLMVNFHWCLTLVMFWKIHLIFIFIIKIILNVYYNTPNKYYQFVFF